MPVRLFASYNLVAAVGEPVRDVRSWPPIRPLTDEPDGPTHTGGPICIVRRSP